MNLYISDVCIEYMNRVFFLEEKNDGLDDVLKLNDAVQSRHCSITQNKGVNNSLGVMKRVKCSRFYVNKIDLCSPPSIKSHFH